MYTFLKILIVILITLYPFFVYFGLNYLSPSQLGLLLLAVFALRVIFVRRSQSARTWPVMLTVIIGATLAGFLLGFIEIFVAMIFPSTLRDLIAYSIVLLILVFRPHGFFGEAYSARLRL